MNRARERGWSTRGVYQEETGRYTTVLWAGQPLNSWWAAGMMLV